MRWYDTSPEKISDERVIEKFLWFPLTIDRETRWLEKVKIRQKATRDMNIHRSGYTVIKDFVWKDAEFLDDELCHEDF